VPRLIPILFILLAAGVFAAFLHSQDARARSDALTLSETNTVPAAHVAAALSTMKLVTVEIDTTVNVQRGDDNWRGTVTAQVSVPVRLHFGTDLAGLQAAHIGVGPLGPTHGLVVTVPKPTRLATDVFSEHETTAIEAGGLRLRSRAGEYYLGIARRDAAEAARNMVLAPDDAIEVERRTAKQVETVVRTIVGRDVPVAVRFTDVLPSTSAAATEKDDR